MSCKNLFEGCFNATCVVLPSPRGLAGKQGNIPSVLLMLSKPIQLSKLCSLPPARGGIFLDWCKTFSLLLSRCFTHTGVRNGLQSLLSSALQRDSAETARSESPLEWGRGREETRKLVYHFVQLCVHERVLIL